MTNNNLPQELADAFKQAGVSTDGWRLDINRDCPVFLAELDENLITVRDCGGELFRIVLMGHCDQEVVFKQFGFQDAIQLADRLKRAILNEPDSRVTELEAINKELCDALETLVSVCENHALVETVFESLVSPNEILNQAKAALAKARSEQS